MPREHSLWFRSIVVCAGAAAMTLVAVRPSAAQFSPGLDPGSTVTVQLDAGRFVNPLPFDVQFFIRGTADTDVTAVRGRYAQLTRTATTCDAALKDAGPGASLGDAAIFTDRDGNRLFELSARPLTPNKDYCFELTLRVQVNAEELRPIVLQAIDDTGRAVYARGDNLARTADYERFRTNVLAAIDALRRKKEAEKNIRLVFDPPPGSFFDAATPAGAIEARYRLQFGTLVQAQTNKRNAVDSYNKAIATATAGMTNLQTMTEAPQLVAQLRDNSDDRLVARRLSGMDSVLALIESSPDDLAATGDEQNADDVDAVWDVATIAARRQRLQAAVRDLRRFDQLTADMLAIPTLRQAAGLDAAAPTALTNTQLGNIRTAADTAADAIDDAADDLERLENLLTRRASAVDAMSVQTLGEIDRLVLFQGTTTADWETRARSYVSADVGVAWSEPIDSFFFYMGANFYFGPVNKKAPLRWRDGGNFRKRFAVMAAIPFNAFAEDPQQGTALSVNGVQLEGVLGDRPLLVGAGLRLNDLVRVTGGAVIFRVKDPNPLVDLKQVDSSWFVSISVDWDVRGMFGALVGTTPAAPRER